MTSSESRDVTVSGDDGRSALAVHLKDITKRFPGVVANDAIDLRVERGTVHALLGENGAGKSTLMNILYGLYEPTEGNVIVDGTKRVFDSPRDAIDAGIGMIHQHFMLVDTMTVAENVVLGYEPKKWMGLSVDRAQANQEVNQLCDRYGFDIDPTAKIEDLGVGAQQRVEIIKALYRGADVLILDEPTAVLTPQEVEGLYDMLSELTDDGKTIIFITHKLEEATRAADAITVLRDGKAVGTVDPTDTTHDTLAELMVGREVLLDVDTTVPDFGDVALSVADLSVDDDRGVETVNNVGFDIRQGEIFGIAGVDGNGQHELIEAVTGLRSVNAGTVELKGTDITGWSRQQRIDAGMAYIPEDRQKRGLITSFNLTENGVLGGHRSEQFNDDGRIRWSSVRQHVQELIDQYDVRTPGQETEAIALSGGNQQKFIVGREVERDPSLLVAAHPTRGVDVGAQEFIHERLLDLREEGVGILLVSSKLEEVLSLSDRVAVISDGQFVDVVDPDTTTEEEIGRLMAGEKRIKSSSSMEAVSHE